MSFKVAFRPQARADLLSIFDFIARSSGKALAGAMVSRIEAACLGLLEFPFRGSRRDDLGPEMRMIAVRGRVTIVYRVQQDVVRIGRIFYAGRNYSSEDLSDV